MHEQVGFPYSQKQGRAANQQATPANRHKARHFSGTHPEDQPYQSTDFDGDAIYDDRFPLRQGSSAIRYRTPETQLPVRRRKIVVHDEPPPQYKKEPVPPLKKEKRKIHWLVFLGGGMLVMVIGWMALNSVSSWWVIQEDTWYYGMPRTYQTDAVVGHHDSPTSPSHFIALNLHGRVEVVEIQGGDPAHSVIYPGPRLLGQDNTLAPVTLTFVDVAGDGKPDMEVHVLGETFIYRNDGTKFVPPSQF